MKKEYHTPTITELPRPPAGAPIKVKPRPAEEPVPAESENFDAEPTEASSSRVEQVRSAQSKLEQKRRDKQEQGPAHASEIKTEW